MRAYKFAIYQIVLMISIIIIYYNIKPLAGLGIGAISACIVLLFNDVINAIKEKKGEEDER